MLKSSVPKAPNFLLGGIAAHSTDWWVMSEDLPDPEHPCPQIRIARFGCTGPPTNTVTHRQALSMSPRDVFREAGYRVMIDRVMGIETNSHQVGTARFGTDPATSVLDPFCKAHDMDNLYVFDASFFPSSTAVNPA